MLPIDRTWLQKAALNQVPEEDADPEANYKTLKTLTDYSDGLNQQSADHAGSDVLPHKDRSVTRDKIALRAVGTDELGDNSVTPAKIPNGSITPSKLAADAIINETINNALITALKAETASRLAEIAINVKAMGAKGDGVSNDLQAIKKAVALVANGGTVHFPAGTYRVVVSNESDSINPSSNVKFTFDKNAHILYGIKQAPYFPLFWMANKQNITFDGLNVIWDGDLDFSLFGANGTNTQYGRTTLGRAFATIIGLDTSSNLKFINCSCKGMSDNNVYDAFIRCFGKVSNVTIDTLEVSHYNNCISDGPVDSSIRNVFATKRSNKVNAIGGVAYYGESHLFYNSLKNCIVDNIREIGVSLNDGNQGGATIQLVSAQDTIITNVITKMKNTPSIFIKGTGVKNLNINNVICDCIDWDDAETINCALGLIDGIPDATNVNMNNITVNMYGNDFTAISCAGTNSSYKNIRVNLSPNADIVYPVIETNKLVDSEVDFNIFNNSTKNVCFLYSTLTSNSSIGGKMKGEGFCKTGTHPKWGSNRGVVYYNSFIFESERNKAPIQIEFNGDEVKYNTISRKNTVNNQIDYMVGSFVSSATKDFILPRNGTFLVNVVVRSGANKGQVVTAIVTLEAGTVNFEHITILSDVKKGDGLNYITTITPKIVDNVTMVTVSSQHSGGGANINQISLHYIAMANFYN